MTWVKLDDGFAGHHKIRGLSHPAFRLHVAGICSCARRLSDGHLDDVDVDVCRLEAGRVGTKYVQELEKSGLWIRTKRGWEIKDYLEYNPPASKVRADRRSAAERQAKSRARRFGADTTAKVNYAAVLERDDYVCHICGDPVTTDQIQFDHVVPLSLGGDHSEDNIKVSHKRCNQAKNNRVTS